MSLVGPFGVEADDARQVQDEDARANARRDEAARNGCNPCSECDATGEIWRDVYVIDGWSVTSSTCPTCNGETWVDAQGRPHKID
jgi:DnaJ-class molecular chaperone